MDKDMTEKEKRLRKACQKACVDLVKATFQGKDSFERTIALLQREIAIAVGSLATLGMDKDSGKDTMANIAAYGLDVYNGQFELSAKLARQGGKMQ